MIVHLSNDLMLVSKVSSWAKSNQLEYKNATTVDAVFQVVSGKSFNDSPDASIRSIVVDLQFKGLEISSFASRLREMDQTTPLIGYAQHVMTELIQQATDTGFTTVVTRGQFDRKLGDLI